MSEPFSSKAPFIHTPTSKLKNTPHTVTADTQPQFSSEQLQVMKTHPALWAQLSGLKVDNKEFKFTGHRFLYPLYADRSNDLRVMKSAQMGATIWMALRAFHQALYPYAWGFDTPIPIGFYFPGQQGLNLMVKSRMEPMMRNCPDLEPYASSGDRMWKPINESTLYFFYMGGKATKDSTPLSSIFFDEVRLMKLADINQAYERVSANDFNFKCHVSTAGLPSQDIHKLFMNSDQKWFTTVCEGCGHEQILALNFPQCIIEHPAHSTRAGDTYYACLKCQKEFRDTQHGLYVPHGDPRHEYSGYHFSQLISHHKSRTAKEIIKSWRESDNMKEWTNGKLGIPYEAADTRPLNMSILESCVDSSLEWEMDEGGVHFMGVDQMLGLNYVFIVSKRPGNDQRRIAWFEIIEDENPWVRTAQLMEDFNVKVCLVDGEPNGNEALRFAQAFRKRVFLVKRGGYDDVIRWGDKNKKKAHFKKATKDSFYQYRVFLDKYKDIERTCSWIKDGQVIWPDPNRRIQQARPLGGGLPVASPIMSTHAYVQLCSPLRNKNVTNENTGEYKWEWLFAADGLNGSDPHGLDALSYALRASERKAYR